MYALPFYVINMLILAFTLQTAAKKKIRKHQKKHCKMCKNAKMCKKCFIRWCYLILFAHWKSSTVCAIWGASLD